jgi:hypothetical protein
MLLEKLLMAHLGKKFLIVYGTGNFITLYLWVQYRAR